MTAVGAFDAATRWRRKISVLAFVVVVEKYPKCRGRFQKGGTGGSKNERREGGGGDVAVVPVFETPGTNSQLAVRSTAAFVREQDQRGEAGGRDSCGGVVVRRASPPVVLSARR